VHRGVGPRGPAFELAYQARFATATEWPDQAGCCLTLNVPQFKPRLSGAFSGWRLEEPGRQGQRRETATKHLEQNLELEVRSPSPAGSPNQGGSG
jgi:hypothetical protein